MAGVTLDVSAGSLRLHRDAGSNGSDVILNVLLPCAVRKDSVAAKFSSSKERLTVSMQCA